MMLPIAFFGGLFLTGLIYYFAVVPFHFWVSRKLNWYYDPSRNRFDSTRDWYGRTK